MKKTLFAFALLAALAACKKDSTDDNRSTATGFSYKAEGTAVTVDSTQAVLYTLGVAPFNRMIDVYAFKGGMQVMEFHFKPTTGSYTADGSFTNCWLTHLTGINFPADYYNSTSGNLTLSVCDTVNKRIQGTFNFVGNNGSATKNITEGSMNIAITEIR
jgi:hypothetical protein